MVIVSRDVVFDEISSYRDDEHSSFRVRSGEPAHDGPHDVCI